MKASLLLFGLGRRQILRETLQRHFARTGSGFLRRIGAVLDQNSLEHVIRFVAPALALSALNRPAKFESNTLHGRGDKLKSIPLQFPRLEKVIEKAALAIRFGVARNKADDATLVFDGELHKFPVAQETIHARVLRTGRCCARPAR